VIGSNDTEMSALGDTDDGAVAGSPLKLHEYLADLQLTPLTSNSAAVSHRPVCLKDARCGTVINVLVTLLCVSK